MRGDSDNCVEVREDSENSLEVGSGTKKNKKLKENLVYDTIKNSKTSLKTE